MIEFGFDFEVFTALPAFFKFAIPARLVKKRCHITAKAITIITIEISFCEGLSNVIFCSMTRLTSGHSSVLLWSKTVPVVQMPRQAPAESQECHTHLRLAPTELQECYARHTRGLDLPVGAFNLR